MIIRKLDNKTEEPVTLGGPQPRQEMRGGGNEACNTELVNQRNDIKRAVEMGECCDREYG